MKFNPDPRRQAEEILFIKKKAVSIHPDVYFNNFPLNSTVTHKHLGTIVDSKLSYGEAFKCYFNFILKFTLIFSLKVNSFVIKLDGCIKKISILN